MKLLLLTTVIYLILRLFVFLYLTVVFKNFKTLKKNKFKLRRERSNVYIKWI